MKLSTFLLLLSSVQFASAQEECPYGFESGRYCGNSPVVPDTLTHHVLYECTDGFFTVKEDCRESGEICYVYPEGENDKCEELDIFDEEEARVGEEAKEDGGKDGGKDAPVEAPTGAPVVAPTDAPVVAPTEAPVTAPTEAPVVATTDAPVAASTDAPVTSPTDSPVEAPTDAPVADASTDAPVPAPTEAAATTTGSPTPYQDGGECLPDNTCEDASQCCSKFGYCGSDSNYCFPEYCVGGNCWTAVTNAPASVPTDAPVDAPTDAPVSADTDAPAAATTDAPVAAPTNATDAPTPAPVPGGGLRGNATDAPTMAPVNATMDDDANATATDDDANATDANATDAPTMAPTDDMNMTIGLIKEQIGYSSAQRTTGGYSNVVVALAGIVMTGAASSIFA